MTPQGDSPHKETEMTATHTDYASEEIGRDGPTGVFREVVMAVAMDHGGNVLAGPGPVARIAARKFRRPVRIVPTVLGGLVGSADTLTEGHTTPKES
jgi:hypothetical protein